MKEIGVEHFGIYLLEARDCSSSKEARQLEQEWMDELCVLDPAFGFNANQSVGKLTRKERNRKWAEDNREASRARGRARARAHRQRQLERDPEAWRARKAVIVAACRKRKAEKALAH